MKNILYYTEVPRTISKLVLTKISYCVKEHLNTTYVQPYIIFKITLVYFYSAVEKHTQNSFRKDTD